MQQIASRWDISKIRDIELRTRVSCIVYILGIGTIYIYIYISTDTVNSIYPRVNFMQRVGYLFSTYTSKFVNT